MLYRRFGSWARVVLAAGLEPSTYAPQATAAALLENLYQLWRRHGRQPKIVDLVPPYSAFRLFPYQRQFGGFENALRAMEKWSRHHKSGGCGKVHRTPRGINGQLRYLILQKDNFKCRACGRSPANEPGVRLQVDHITPWSTGGETVAKNLQTLCQQCNLGKSNR
jgi:5-methylcytosine-specific restriction endonuclease McrA